MTSYVYTVSRPSWQPFPLSIGTISALFMPISLLNGGFPGTATLVKRTTCKSRRSEQASTESHPAQYPREGHGQRSFANHEPNTPTPHRGGARDAVLSDFVITVGSADFGAFALSECGGRFPRAPAFAGPFPDQRRR
ncbi:hypothetical protein VUR80DRAFT_6732 [Thermomyces stellatus]